MPPAVTSFLLLLRSMSCHLGALDECPILAAIAFRPKV
jgi:hypothetical protein